MKHEVSMHVALGLRLTALGVKKLEIALQRYESFLNKMQSSPPKMWEKRVWREDQERDPRGSIESPQCDFGRVGGQIFFLSLSPPCCLKQELREPVSKSPTGVTKVFEQTVLRGHSGDLVRGMEITCPALNATACKT